MFVEQARVLSEYRYLIDHEPLEAVALSNIEQHRWLSYYIQSPPEMKKGQGVPEASQHTLELMVHRTIGRGLHEDVQLTNFNQKASSFSLTLKLDANFADQQELSQGRQQHGELTRTWKKRGEQWSLQFDYNARHQYSHQGDAGVAELHRGVLIVFSRCGSVPHMDGSAVSFEVKLKRGESWRACLDFLPIVDGEAVQADGVCVFTKAESELDKEECRFKSEACTVETAPVEPLDAVVCAAVERARDDLAAVRA